MWVRGPLLSHRCLDTCSSPLAHVHQALLVTSNQRHHSNPTHHAVARCLSDLLSRECPCAHLLPCCDTTCCQHPHPRAHLYPPAGGLSYAFTSLGDQVGLVLPAAYLAVPGLPRSPYYGYAGGITLVMVIVAVLGVLATRAEPGLIVLGR